MTAQVLHRTCMGATYAREVDARDVAASPAWRS